MLLVFKEIEERGSCEKGVASGKTFPLPLLYGSIKLDTQLEKARGIAIPLKIPLNSCFTVFLELCVRYIVKT